MELRTDPKAVIAHWHQLIEHLNASPVTFYDSVEAALSGRCVPDSRATRIEYQEAGAMSAKRLYLHVARGKHVVDVCAAPFGTGFFVSSWLADTRAALPWWGKLLALFGYAVALSMALNSGGLIAGTLFLAALVGLGLWAVNEGGTSTQDAEAFVLALPIIGWIYERLFKADTYYSMDTALMFRDAVHNSVLEAVDGLTSAHGLRALSEAERRPINRELFGPSRR
jgi:hypothetical protein